MKNLFKTALFLAFIMLTNTAFSQKEWRWELQIHDFKGIRTSVVDVLSVELQTGAMLTMTMGARLVAEIWDCAGASRGCEMQVLIKGTSEVAATTFNY